MIHGGEIIECAHEQADLMETQGTADGVVSYLENLEVCPDCFPQMLTLHTVTLIATLVEAGQGPFESMAMAWMDGFCAGIVLGRRHPAQGA